jgi:type II secretory pathway component PulF
VPGLKEASIARLSRLFGMMLQSGCSLKETLPVLRQVERGTPVQRMIRVWEQTIAEGGSRFESLAKDASPLPPLFFWLVGTDRENWTAGLLRAAAIYHNRARNKLELLLTAVLPVSVIILGVLILLQTYSLYVGLLSGFLDIMV